MDLSGLEGYENISARLPEGFPVWILLVGSMLLSLSIFIVFFFISIFKWGQNKGVKCRMFTLGVSIFNAVVYIIPIFAIISENTTEQFCMVSLILFIISIVLSIATIYVRGDYTLLKRIKISLFINMWKSDWSTPGVEATEEYETTTTYTYSDGSTRTEVSYSDNGVAPSSGILLKLLLSWPVLTLDVFLFFYLLTLQIMMGVIQALFGGWIVTIFTSIFRKELE